MGKKTQFPGAIAMSGGVKSEIISQIAKTEDANVKVVLLMLLGVLDEISTKIDAMRNDEDGLRAAVLNGHEPVHHEHHEWVARKIREEEEDAKAVKDSWRMIRDGLLEKFIWVVLVLAAGSGWVLK